MIKQKPYFPQFSHNSKTFFQLYLSIKMKYMLLRSGFKKTIKDEQGNTNTLSFSLTFMTLNVISYRDRV